MSRLFDDSKPKTPAAIQYLQALSSGSLAQYVSDLSASPSHQANVDDTSKLTEHHVDLTAYQRFSDYLQCMEHSNADLTVESFKAGLQGFSRIANMSYAERATFYGNPYYGLHYRNNLADQCNAEHAQSINMHEVANICPTQWTSQSVDGLKVLLYKGDNPAEALDRLLLGPTVIDCGMFCQLSLLFAIKTALGNAQFNLVFAGLPLYLTQVMYNKVLMADKPYQGNPLFDFFDKDVAVSKGHGGIAVEYVENDPLYRYKHPAGSSSGQNCLMVDGQYIIFDPEADRSSGLTRHDVSESLRKDNDAEQDRHDLVLIAEFERHPDTIHPYGESYSELATKADVFRHYKVNRPLPTKSSAERHIVFNLDRFKSWVSSRQHVDLSVSDNYRPLAANQLCVPSGLLAVIPIENRAAMSFSAYKRESTLQQKLYRQSLHFCHQVMTQSACMLTLTGQAGIGKTAAAVACAKELASRGKRIVWISEVLVSGWVNKVATLEQLEAVRNQVRRLLDEDPAAVFVDDNNLVGYAGKVIIEEVYRWYMTQSGKGVFITSNEPLSLADCYGYKLDKHYHFPPFLSYQSPNVVGMTTLSQLIGRTQRPALQASVAELDDAEKIKRLMALQVMDRSVGIVVAPSVYEQQAKQLGNVEYIPGFSEANGESLLTPIRYSLMHFETKGPVYDKLSAVQKHWLHTFAVPELTMHIKDGEIMTMPKHIGIAPRHFESTSCPVIVIELQQNLVSYGSRSDCFKRLLEVINVAHDTGGKKVIVINMTGLSHQELMEKVKSIIPKRERERTIARLDQLFYSFALTPAASEVVCSSDARLPVMPEMSAVTTVRNDSPRVSDTVAVEIPVFGDNGLVNSETLLDGNRVVLALLALCHIAANAESTMKINTDDNRAQTSREACSPRMP